MLGSSYATCNGRRTRSLIAIEVFLRLTRMDVCFGPSLSHLTPSV